MSKRFSTKIDANKQEKLSRAVLQELGKNKKILDLTEQDIDDTIFKQICETYIKNSTVIETLELFGNQLTDIGVTDLVECLKANTKIHTVKLEWNSITADGAAKLAECLKNNMTLKRLELYGNKVGDRGMKMIAMSLKNNETLEFLGLFGNNITDTGAAELIDALRSNRTLKEIDLDNNNISDQLLTKIEVFLQRNNNQAVPEAYKAIASTSADAPITPTSSNGASITTRPTPANVANDDDDDDDDDDGVDEKNISFAVSYKKKVAMKKLKHENKELERQIYMLVDENLKLKNKIGELEIKLSEKEKTTQDVWVLLRGVKDEINRLEATQEDRKKKRGHA